MSAGGGGPGPARGAGPWLGSLAFNVGWYALTAVVALGGAPLLLASARVVRGWSRFWVRGVLGWLAATRNLRHRVRGAENLPAGPFLIASKHQSSWETLAFATLFPDCAIVLKRELYWIPVVGWAMARAGNIGVDRKAGAKALRRMLREAEAAASEGRPILIFPEGTRVAVGSAPPYQPGVAALYAHLKLPVVPVALNSGVFWPRRAFVKRSGTIEVEILPPIPAGLPRTAFVGRLRAAIEPAAERLAAAAR